METCLTYKERLLSSICYAGPLLCSFLLIVPPFWVMSFMFFIPVFPLLFTLPSCIVWLRYRNKSDVIAEHAKQSLLLSAFLGVLVVLLVFISAVTFGLFILMWIPIMVVVTVVIALILVDILQGKNPQRSHIGTWFRSMASIPTSLDVSVRPLTSLEKILSIVSYWSFFIWVFLPLLVFFFAPALWLLLRYKNESPIIARHAWQSLMMSFLLVFLWLALPMPLAMISVLCPPIAMMIGLVWGVITGCTTLLVIIAQAVAGLLVLLGKNPDYHHLFPWLAHIRHQVAARLQQLDTQPNVD